MIRLYTDTTMLVPKNRRIVHPLLFDLHYFETPHPDVHKLYALVTTPEEADVFIFPVNYLSIINEEYQEKYTKLHKLALDHNKKLMVYVGGDYGKTFNDNTIIVWRNAGFKRTNDSQTIVIPAFIDDPLKREDVNQKVLDCKSKPKVSFTGFATASIGESLRITLSTAKGNVLRFLKKDVTDTQTLFNAAGQRYKALKKLENSKFISTQFIYRNKYRAGATNKEEREHTTREFYINLNDSPYTFCLRGAGNFSIRFYESLACGRIPILIDTDCSLTLENVIPWDEHICRVQYGDDLERSLLSFHKSYNKESFITLQKSNRALYENYLVRDRFFCNLYPDLKQML